MNIFEKIKKKYFWGKRKFWKDVADLMNYPTKTIFDTTFIIVTCLSIGTIGLVSNIVWWVNLGGFILILIGIYNIYDGFIIPLKRYETRYGKTGLGDEALKKYLKN